MDTAENTTVHLGPGVFETKGYWHWRPKSGQKIIGSGMGVTTLKIVGANIINFLNFAIGTFFNEPLAHFEVSDLTVDCNLPGQPVTPGYERARVACGAISVTGRHIRIRRVRAINFGTQGVDLAPAPGNPECFVISTAGAYIDGNPDAFDCVIEDCIIEKPSQNNTRETTCMLLAGGEAGYSGYMSYHRACVIRNCHVNCEFANGVSSHPIPVDSLTRDPGNLSRAILISRSPHNRTANDVVVIINAHEGSNPVPSALFNGAFEIESVGPESNRLTYLMTSAPSADATGDIFIWAPFQAFSADGGSATVIEGNRAQQCRVGVFHDTFSTKDLTIRNNHFRDVFTGVQQNMSGVNAAKVGQILTHDGSNATFTTQFDHGLAADDAVIIAGAVHPEYNSTETNPAFRVKSVGASNAFTYEMIGVPSGDEPSPPSFTFRTLWQERHLVIENNVFEMAAAVDNWGEPFGIYLVGGTYVSPYVFLELVIRGNVIRHVDNVMDPPSYMLSSGIIFTSCEKAIVENNVIDLDGPFPIRWRDTGSFRFFNNQNADGKLLDAYNDVTGQYTSDAARAVEDALLIAL